MSIEEKLLCFIAINYCLASAVFAFIGWNKTSTVFFVLGIVVGYAPEICRWIINHYDN